MFNNSFKIGDSNTNLGENSTVLGGNGNFIAFGAENISLQGCVGVIVEGDVVNFIGVNLTNRVIDSSYSNSTLLGKHLPRILRVTADFTIDGLYDIYEIDLDTIGVGITCTWDVYAYPIVVVFKCYANATVSSFTIDDVNSPSTTIDGNALPYVTGMATNDSMVVYSNRAALKVLATNGGGGSGATVFTDLTDVPATYVGQALKTVRVNAGETGLEFVTGGAGGAWGAITGTISDQTDLMSVISLRI